MYIFEKNTLQQLIRVHFHADEGFTLLIVGLLYIQDGVSLHLLL